MKILLEFDLFFTANNDFLTNFVSTYPQFFTELDEPKLSTEGPLTVYFNQQDFTLEQFVGILNSNTLTYSVFDPQTLVFKNSNIRNQIEILYVLSFPSTLSNSYLISDVYRPTMKCPNSKEMKSFEALLGDKFVEPIPKFTVFDLSTLSFQLKGERCGYFDSIIHHYENIDISQTIIDIGCSGISRVWLTNRNKFCYLDNPKIAQKLDDITKSCSQNTQNTIVGILRIMAPNKIITLGKESLIVVDSKNQTIVLANAKISVEILKAIFPGAQFIEN